MESKRKATTAASPGGDGRTPKRRKGPQDFNTDTETPETTTETGLGFLAQLKQARDKNGRLITTDHDTLPDKDQLPRYYEKIVLPLAVDTIEAKLNSRSYPTLTTLESDVKRMVTNSKRFYDKSSEKYRDAERIRKMLANWMPKHNPAYQDRNYQSFPTPLPGEVLPNQGRTSLGDPDGEADAEAVTDDEVAPQDTNSRLRGAADSARGFSAKPSAQASSSTPIAQVEHAAENDFNGLTFQRAQEKILSDMYSLRDDDDQSISLPFHKLPPQQLRDYYSLIKRPVSLNSIHKKIQGFHGREKPTVSKSLFQSWASFEEEISFIWLNAKDYNEDGSEIYELAGELEQFFYQQLKQAKKAVREPPQPIPQPNRIKLNMSTKSPGPAPKIKLRVNAVQKGSPAPVTPSNARGVANKAVSPDVAIDGGALEWQQKHVQAGINGHDASTRSGSKNPFGSSGSGPAAGNIPTLSSLSLDRANSASAASPTPSTSAVKAEIQAGQSPALSTVNPSGSNGEVRRDSHGSNQAVQSPYLGASAMPPPSSVTPRLPSGSPHPSIQPHAHLPYIPNAVPVAPSDSKWRQPGKDASDALISNISISTHAGLNIKRHFHLDVPPSATLSQQSITFNLLPTQHYLQIVPTIAFNLNNRQYKVFVTTGMRRLQPAPQPPSQLDPQRPLYEVKLETGVNRVEIEIIAGPLRGAAKAGSGQDIEFEKVTLFANLLKA
ncbi:MAG: hypothetical protein M1812_006450 [Candelaria pacifica]|nr:MAG: hypothetical protein M1812_006450 [Candelaria pacifica]